MLTSATFFFTWHFCTIKHFCIVLLDHCLVDSAREWWMLIERIPVHTCRQVFSRQQLPAMTIVTLAVQVVLKQWDRWRLQWHLVKPRWLLFLLILFTFWANSIVLLSPWHTTDKNRLTMSADKNLSCVIKKLADFCRPTKMDRQEKFTSVIENRKICRLTYWPVIGQRRCVHDGDRMEWRSYIKVNWIVRKNSRYYMIHRITIIETGIWRDRKKMKLPIFWTEWWVIVQNTTFFLTRLRSQVWDVGTK